jgi:hypothetical protein
MTSKPAGCQATWFDLIKRCGSEEAARAELARQLRRAAELVETRGYPDVFGCEIWVGQEPESMETVSVTLSYLWGG